MDLFPTSWNSGSSRTLAGSKPFTRLSALRRRILNLYTRLQRKRKLLARLNGIQRALADHHSANLKTLEYQLRMEFEKTCTQEELLKQQNARTTWLCQGDRNTKAFHSRFRHKKSRNSIKELRLEVRILEPPYKGQFFCSSVAIAKERM